MCCRDEADATAGASQRLCTCRLRLRRSGFGAWVAPLADRTRLPCLHPRPRSPPLASTPGQRLAAIVCQAPSVSNIPAWPAPALPSRARPLPSRQPPRHAPSCPPIMCALRKTNVGFWRVPCVSPSRPVTSPIPRRPAYAHTFPWLSPGPLLLLPSRPGLQCGVPVSARPIPFSASLARTSRCITDRDGIRDAIISTLAPAASSPSLSAVAGNYPRGLPLPLPLPRRPVDARTLEVA